MDNQEVIRSKENSFYKRIKSYQSAKYRKQDNCFVAEGEKLLFEALASCSLKHILMSQSYYMQAVQQLSAPHDHQTLKPALRLLHVAEESSAQLLTVLSDNLFCSLSELKTSQGVLGVFELPAHEVDVSGFNKVVVLEGVQDPKNVGAIIRSAHCLGYEAVVLDCCCAQPFSPKVIRSSMGSVFHVPVVSCQAPGQLLQQIAKLKDSGFYIVGTALSGTEKVVAKAKIALLIGSEGGGLSSQSMELCDHIFTITMAESAQSLNAAVACGIALYLFNTDSTK
ncbi:MAG: RNA methyltransferase [Coriobacteriia bacterium]|nr:RNA methyltransferase [Coriobacteriia bacterium]